MNGLGWVDGVAARWLQMALPLRCLLCGAAGDGVDLCRPCGDELARNEPACGRCALPLSMVAARCGVCLRRAPPFDAAFAPFRYVHPIDLLEARFKFHGDLAAGRVLADLFVARARECAIPIPDALVPVPLHLKRLRERGYNQALELSRRVGRATGAALLVDALRRDRPTPPQMGLDARSRRRNMRGAFVVPPRTRLPAHIALVDDVMTTGATLAECARVLRAAGVSRIDVWAIARAPRRR